MSKSSTSFRVVTLINGYLRARWQSQSLDRIRGQGWKLSVFRDMLGSKRRFYSRLGDGSKKESRRSHVVKHWGLIWIDIYTYSQSYVREWTESQEGTTCFVVIRLMSVRMHLYTCKYTCAYIPITSRLNTLLQGVCFLRGSANFFVSTVDYLDLKADNVILDLFWFRVIKVILTRYSIVTIYKHLPYKFRLDLNLTWTFSRFQ